MRDNFKNFPVFMYAFYQHFVIKEFLVAKRLYKHAIKRSECIKGSYQLLCSIYFQIMHSGKNSKLQTIQQLEAKLQKLDDKFGNIMRYDNDYAKLKHKINMYLMFLEAE